MALNENLLRESRPVVEGNFDSATYLSVRGLYNSMQFVLRLHPDIHEILETTPAGIVKSGDITYESFQAFSTYLMSNIGFLFSSQGLFFSRIADQNQRLEPIPFIAGSSSNHSTQEGPLCSTTCSKALTTAQDVVV